MRFSGPSKVSLIRTVKFDHRGASAFAGDVKERVAAYFEASERSSKADARMNLRAAIMLGITFGAYALILAGGFSPWGMLALAVAMGVGMAGIGFCVAHDALHGAYSHDPRVNRLLGYSFDLVGANGYLWKLTHNGLHHTYTNIHGLDEDLTVSPLLRLSPSSRRRWFHRFQHVYAWPAYALATLNWIFVKDYQQLFKRELGPYRDMSHPRHKVAELILTKAAVYGYTLVVPLVVLEVAWWQFGIGFLAMHLTAGLILGVVFQLAHVVEGTAHPTPGADGVMGQPWLVHEMDTTANFAPGASWLSWYIGGLNYQIEHHLFPRVCSVHYPALAPIVREVAQVHGVPYHCQPTLGAAVRSHYAMLKALGRPVPA